MATKYNANGKKYKLKINKKYKLFLNKIKTKQKLKTVALFSDCF